MTVNIEVNIEEFQVLYGHILNGKKILNQQTFWILVDLGGSC